MADGTSGDNTDVAGCFGTSETKSEKEDDYDDYIMEYPKRGKCYIFNHETFDEHTGYSVRKGTAVDALRLSCRFRGLGFEIEQFNDLTVREVTEKLEEAGNRDYSDESCFVCCILSHGEYGMLCARDGKYPTEKVFAPFRDAVCPSLVGKPKLFFIQACQGKKADSGVPCKERLDTEFTFKIPSDLHFLAAYSTFPGFMSFRQLTKGSWFIQALCAGIRKHAKEKDILSVLTIVNREVAFQFESYVTTDITIHEKKQISVVVHTLTRNLRFP